MSIRSITKKAIMAMPGRDMMWDWIRRLREQYWKRLTPDQYPEALSRWFKNATGDTLDWNKLVTFNQKLQWLKLHDTTPLKTQLADKYRVREWVANKIGEKYLIPLLGMWERAQDVDFNTLPDKFVLKANHGSGMNIIVHDKTKLNIKKTRKTLKSWLNRVYGHIGLELQYRDMKPCIVAEQYIENIAGDVSDYKFMCFNGKVEVWWIDSGRFGDHRRSFFNLKGEPLNVKINLYEPIDNPKVPDNYQKMIEIAEKLCAEFKFVRVDLYNINGQILFGEMTFTPASGVYRVSPPEYAVHLGSLIQTEK
ncbi:MAG: hypothetical protein FWD53_03905 [Phycisphaerales bacterium]|nr:hypothetical protein [Phycisphaerales bacterium]